MSGLIGLDFETYSAVDLRVHGLYNYVHSPTFKPLIAAVAVEGMASEVLDLTGDDYKMMRDDLIHLIGRRTIVAHNAGFEQAVLDWMGIPIPANRFIDSAVLARAYGAGGSLEASAAQILGQDKVEAGKNLIQLFSIPGKYQEKEPFFDAAIKYDHHHEWMEFGHYCKVDAQLSLAIAIEILPQVQQKELDYASVTLEMNKVGWHVDVDLVKEMQSRYLSNVSLAVAEFQDRHGAHDLNLSSTTQLKLWCRDRGVVASSFDEQHVETLLKLLQFKVGQPSLPKDKLEKYLQVSDMLLTKKTMGGSSLKKLTTILNTVGEDGRLHDQYLHVGAGATYRTTGRGVQMQNLKRLNGEGDDMAELYVAANIWDNDKLASNLRQVFTSTHPHGRLVVGDFSSVESRGLAWQSGETWKLNAYEKGDDLYKVLASRIFNIPVEDVTKEQRQIGKVGELACGYGAGPGAVKDFAAKMGVDLSEGESTKLVKDWRDANTHIVDYWYDLDRVMHMALDSEGPKFAMLPHGYVTIEAVAAPHSLSRQLETDATSLMFSMYVGGKGSPLFTRYIHGAAQVGKNIQYWKPSERKTGDLWVDRYTDPKTKHTRLYTVYGGKLTGLLTQSLCREVFFESLLAVSKRLKAYPNVNLIGQFHDEIVLDWEPSKTGPNLGQTVAELKELMTATSLPGFPLAAEIKADYRYTK